MSLGCGNNIHRTRQRQAVRPVEGLDGAEEIAVTNLLEAHFAVITGMALELVSQHEHTGSRAIADDVKYPQSTVRYTTDVYVP